MKIIGLSQQFDGIFVHKKVKHSDYSFYFDLEGDSYSYDLSSPYSMHWMRKVNWKNKEIFKFTEKNEDYPKSILAELDFSPVLINGVSEAEIYSHIFFENRILEWRYKDGESTYYLYGESLVAEEVKLDVTFSSIANCLVLSDAYYFVDTGPTIVTKTDKSFKSDWKCNLKNEHKSGYTNTQLFSYEDSIISNIGCTDEETQNDGEVISLYKDSGEIKWSKHFDHEIHSCNVVKDRIYLTGHNQWYVLNAQNGETLLKGDADLGEHIEGTGNSLWSDGDFLYFSSSHGNVIRVYCESNGEFWGDILMPEGYKIDWETPVSKGGYHYFKLIGSNWAEQGTVHGVLVVTAKEMKYGTPFNIEIETYDKVNKYLEESKGESLILEFDDNELGNILRFGQIEANRYVVNNTYNLCASMAPDYGEHINKAFNGEVIIKIKKDSLDEKLEDRLDLMCEFINDHNKDCIAPFKKQNVKATWQWI